MDAVAAHAWPAGRRAAKRRTALTLSIFEQFLDGLRRLRENGGQKALGTFRGVSYRWHMEKITEYFLVAAWVQDSNGAKGLNGAVKAKIDEGYQPFGSPFTIIRELTPPPSTRICQAMVKYRKA